MILLLACQPMQTTAYEYTIEESAGKITAAEVTAATDIGLNYLASIRSSELYQVYEYGLQFGDGFCPGIFDAVQGSFAWNNECESNQLWQYSGRAQVLYLEEETHLDVFYELYGYFISNARITDPDGGILLMEGYGDLRKNEQEVWMELFGSFSYSGSVISSDWLNEEASISLRKTYNVADEFVQINGGMSRYSGLPEGVAGISLDNVTLDVSAACTVIEGRFSVLGTEGDRILFQLTEGMDCQACSMVRVQQEDIEVCWDLNGFSEVEQW